MGERLAVVFFEGFQPTDKSREGFAQNVGKFSVFKVGGWGGGVGAPFDDFAGDPHDHGVRRDIFDHHGVGADAAPLADGHRAKNFCPRADHNSFRQGGMAFAFDERCPPQRDPLVECDVGRDLRGFADNDAHAVVNEQPLADDRAGMDFHPGDEPSRGRNPSRQQFKSDSPQPVGHPMGPKGVNAGIEQNDFQRVSGGRIAVKRGLDILPESF